MKAECEASDHDDEDNGDGEEGNDHILKEDDVFSSTRAICRQCQVQHENSQMLKERRKDRKILMNIRTQSMC